MKFFFDSDSDAGVAYNEAVKQLGFAEIHPYESNVFVADKWQMKVILLDEAQASYYYMIEIYNPNDATFFSLIISELNFKIQE